MQLFALSSARTRGAATLGALALAVGLATPLASPASGAPPGPSAAATAGTTRAGGCDPFRDPLINPAVPTAQDVLGMPLGQQDVTVAQSDRYLRAVVGGEPQGHRRRPGPVLERSAAALRGGRQAAVGQAGGPALDRPEPERAPRRRHLPAPGAADHRPHPGRAVDRGQRARQRGERHRRVPARALRARGPHRLHRPADPRPRDRGRPAQPEPRRPRGRHPTQRLRLRPEPGLVRPHPAGDRRQGRAAAEAPSAAVRRRPRDGRRTATSSRPTPTRSTTRSARRGRAGSTTLRHRDAGRPSTRAGSRYFNYATYDLFYMGYGDTVPATGVRRRRHDVREGQRRPRAAAGASSSTSPSGPRSRPPAVGTSRRILRGWHGTSRPRARARPASSSPTGSTTRATRSSDQVPDRRSATTSCAPTTRPSARGAALVRRLQRMDVEVCRLTAPLTVPRLPPYGRAARGRTLPAGTYWVPMAQAPEALGPGDAQRGHLHPFPYFYDVTAWSSPLLFNVAGGYLRRGAPAEHPVAGAQAEPAPPALPAGAPDRALLDVAAVLRRHRVLRLAALAARPLGRLPTAT